MTAPTVVITDTSEATSGDITVMAPGTVWLRTGDKVFTNIRSASYQWTASAVSGEYYLEAAGGGDPGITNSDVRVYYSGHRLEEDTVGALSDLSSPSSSTSGSFGVGDNDSLGFTTIYVRINTGSGPVDPDTLTAGRIYYSHANASFAYGEGDADTVDRIAWDFGDDGTQGDADQIGWNAAHCYEERLTGLNGSWTASGSEWVYDTPITAGTNPRVYQNGGTGYSGDPMTLGTAGALTAGQFAFDGTSLHVRLTGDADPNSAGTDEIAFANQYSCTVTCTVTNQEGESASATRTVLVNPCTRTRQWFDADSGNNANPGTKASPKQNLDGATRNVANYRWMLKNGVTATYRHHEQQNDNQVLQGYGPGAAAVVQNDAAQTWTIMTRGSVNVWMDFVLLGQDNGTTFASGFVNNTSANEDSGSDGYWTVLRVTPRTASGDDLHSFVSTSMLHKGLLVQGCEGETDATSGQRAYMVFAVPGQADQVHPARHIVVIHNDNGYGSRDEAVTRIEGQYVALAHNTFSQTDSNQSGNVRWKSGIRWPGGSNMWAHGNTLTNCGIGINPASNSAPASEFIWEKNLLVNDGDGSDPDNANLGAASSNTVTGGVVRNNILDSRSAAGTSTAGFVNLDFDDYSTGTLDGTRFLGNSFLGGVNTTQFYTLRVTQNAAGDVSGLIWRANATVNPASTASATVTASDAYMRADEIDDAGDDLFAELDANISAPLASRTGTSFDPDHIAHFTTSAPADTFKSWADLEGLAGVSGANNEELDISLAGLRLLIDGMTPRATPDGLRRTYDDLTRVAVTYSGAAYATDLTLTASGEIGTNEIVVDFGTEIDAATLSTASFSVERDGNPVPFSVPGSVESSQTITLTLSANLFSGSAYVVDFTLGQIVLAGGVVFVNSYPDIPVTLTGGTVSGQRSRDRYSDTRGAMSRGAQ